MNTSALLILIKNLEKGKVKTRLASTLGDDQALKIYRALLEHTRQIACSVDVDRMLFYSNYIVAKDDWSASDFQKLLQADGDLGERITQAFAQAFIQHERVVIIGSDCASLSQEIVEAAFAALENQDFVVGPATDGGYYLLGMNTFEPSVFQDITWSTEHVLAQTIERIQSLGKSYHQLPTLSDIDYEADWKEFGWELD